MSNLADLKGNEREVLDKFFQLPLFQQQEALASLLSYSDMGVWPDVASALDDAISEVS